MTASQQELAWVTALPKAHLHVHLEGAARAPTIAKLAARQGRPAPGALGFTNLPGFVDCYRRVTDVIQMPSDLALVITEFVADEAAQGVLYSEPMIGPWLYADRFGWSVSETFAFIDDAFQQATRSFDVEVRYLLGVNWGRPTEWIERAATFAVDHVGSRVAGLGFAGVEPRDGFDRYASAAAIVRTHGLLVVPHIGETHGPQSIRAAVAAMRPHRIAHGIHAADDPGLLDQLAELGIGCDVCPSSNVQLGVVSTLADHPLPLLLLHGIAATLGADDPLLFGTTLANEYQQVGSAFGLSDQVLATLAAADSTTTGMTGTTRTRLRSAIQQWLINQPPEEGCHHG